MIATSYCNFEILLLSLLLSIISIGINDQQVNLFLKLYPSFVFYSDFPLTTLFRNKQYEHFEKCISFFKIKEPVLPLVMLKNHKSKANYIFNSNEKKCISLFFKKMFQVGKFTPEILEKIINIEIKTITKKLYLSEKIREF